MTKRRSFSSHLKFLIAAIVLMVLIDQFMFGGTRPYIEADKVEQAVPVDITAPVVFLPPAENDTKTVPPEPALPVDAERADSGIEEIAYSENIPAWIRNAVTVKAPPGKPKIAVIIDDLGENAAGTRGIVALPGPLTLAYLPYPANIRESVAQGRAAGHEIMVHMPMEPVDGALAKGDYLLREGMTSDELRRVLVANLDAFDGYVGINNHMGSRLTQDREAMGVVMEELKKRGLLFVDSRTISSSVAEDVAAAHGIPHASRNVFLDNDPSLENARASLAKLEEIARSYGSAIAIGHPKENTIRALHEWLPTLEEKGFALVPVSMLVRDDSPTVLQRWP